MRLLIAIFTIFTTFLRLIYNYLGKVVYYVVNNIGIKTIIYHTVKLYQLSENDSSMQNVEPFLILIPYTKFKYRYYLVNGILSKTVLLQTDKPINSEQWVWNISKEGQKRSDIKTVSLLSQRNLSQREKKSKNRSVLCLVFAQLQLFFKRQTYKSL